jgi:hypothetical protein
VRGVEGGGRGAAVRVTVVRARVVAAKETGAVAVVDPVVAGVVTADT